MKYKQRIIDLRTTEGFKTAERLQAQGWKVIGVGFHTIIMEKSGKLK